MYFSLFLLRVHASLSLPPSSLSPPSPTVHARQALPPFATVEVTANPLFLSLVSAQPEDEMESGVFSDAIVRQQMAVYQLLALRDEPVIIGRHLSWRLDSHGAYLGKRVLLGIVRITNDKVY